MLSKTFFASYIWRVEAEIIFCQLKMKSMCVYLKFYAELSIYTIAKEKNDHWFLVKGVNLILFSSFTNKMVYSTVNLYRRLAHGYHPLVMARLIYV